MRFVPPSTSISTGLASGPFTDLFRAACLRDDTVVETLDLVLNEILAYDSSIVTSWESLGLMPRVQSYSLFYVLPVRELWQESSTPQIPVLAAQLLSCVAWRTFDDCVDGHVAVEASYLPSIMACLDVIRYVETRIGGDNVTRDIFGHYSIMCEQANKERREALPLDDIWKRCSIFLYAPEVLAGLSNDCLAVYRDYLCYAGLAHDVTDLLSDLSAGIISLPVLWFREVSEFGVVTIDTVERLYDRVRAAASLIEARFLTQEFEARYPLMNLLFCHSMALLYGR